MPIKLYNSLSHRVEEFKPIEEGRAGLYTCGPTVYNYAHIGNFRCYAFEDILKRTLLASGLKVRHVMNLTDVDDKTIRGSQQQHLPLREFTRKYKEAFFEDIRTLRILPADVYPAATDHIPEMIELIQKLFDKGIAYQAEDKSVYFSIEKWPQYGQLVKLDRDAMRVGVRVKMDEYAKDSMADFALWKAWDEADGEVAWDSPWGKGRPGWHIECSAMSNRYLGKTIDIHCGGEDLQFPHHENEIAQSEAANGCTFVHYWLHNGFLNINNQKMSKSLGNFFTVREAAEAYGYEAVRFFMLSAQYRSPLNYSRDSLIMAQNSLERLYTAESNLEFLTKNGADGDMTAEEKAFTETFDSYRQKFDDAMDDDLNTADAISVIFELVRAINIAVEKNPTKALASACLDMLHEFTDVLGLLYNKKAEDDSLDSKVEAMIEARQAARKAKNFAEADRIRDELKSRGIELIDTPQGASWKRI